MSAPEPIPGARLLFSNDAAVAQLNHGSFGLVPIPVQRAQQRLRDEMEANPPRFFGVGLEERVAHVRRHLAAFIGADPDGTALVENATTGVAIVLAGLDLGTGDEVVTTDHGYGAVDLAVDELCRRTGASRRVARLPLTAQDDDAVGAVLDAVTGRTRLVIVDQITSPTARVLPVRRIVEAVRGRAGERVAILVDAAHAPGILPDPVAGVDADFWVGNFHKWAYAPRGTALLTVAARWRDRIRPLAVSWSQPAGFPGNLEWVGARDYTPWLAAPVGLFVLRSLGVDAVRRHNVALAEHGQALVAAALDVDVPARTGLPMAVVPLPPGTAGDPAAVVALRRRISDELTAEVALNSWRGQGYLRLSAQVYNREEDFQRLVEGLPKLLGR
ncbi:aminotransferase class V-fold PLP-dependent enzyme [Dactylosporangium siamense]|uniref:Isopenicillin-N epimerase n=1 Tax=Dactylosporangium siamense TaxID=685454 RepID=A0A919UB82_9ACTN|nr:aminotransferase class V-fold PLP-dependent enzyme [Dactylosporangium siamense]GIG44398.1 isopenicillin-N epimerase [Dactylosporangium siamense]